MNDARRNNPVLPPRILMGPGPSDVSPRVLAAGAKPTIGHLDPEFQILMDEIKGQLKRVFRTQNDVTFPVSGPGSVGMEACFVNLIEPGDTVIVCQNGVFGGRMKENVERCGGIVVAVDDEMGKPVDPDKLRAALKANPNTTAVAFVHAETSTGVVSDAATLCKIARDAGYRPIPARARAERIVTLLQGSLVLSRGLDAAKPFRTILAELPKALLKPGAPDRTHV